MTYDVPLLRRSEFPWTAETIYLNHASIGPIPERARRALEDHARERAAPGRLTDDRLVGVLREARERAARLIGAEPGEIALATNTSYGLNLAARMLPFRPGDIVVTSDREFPANVFPWRALADRGVALELVPVTPEGWPDEQRILARLRDPRVRAVTISQVQFHNGYLIDLARFSAEARATDTFLVVDAIQGLGQVPLDVRATPVDVLACGAQKWLLSPWGSGFMYVRKELIPALVSPLAGWTAFEGTDDFTTLCDYSGGLRGDARRYELVTLPFQDFLGMNHALTLLEELGITAIRDHLESLLAPVRDWAGRSGVRVLSPAPPRAAGMVCLAAADVPGGLAALRAAGVTATVREGALRLSPHCYNTREEMERVVGVLEESLAASR